MYQEACDNFLEMITVQEELVKVDMIQSETNWPVSDRIEHLNLLLNLTKFKIIPIEVLLNEKLQSDPSAVLENVMVSIRTHTTSYQGTVNALRCNKKQEINSKLEELNSILSDGNNENEIEALEAELNSITDEMLQ